MSPACVIASRVHWRIQDTPPSVNMKVLAGFRSTRVTFADRRRRRHVLVRQNHRTSAYTRSYVGENQTVKQLHESSRTGAVRIQAVR